MICPSSSAIHSAFQAGISQAAVVVDAPSPRGTDGNQSILSSSSVVPVRCGDLSSNSATSANSRSPNASWLGAFAVSRALTLLAQRIWPVLIVELQNVPEPLGAIKEQVDRRPDPGRFFVTGSVCGEIDTHRFRREARHTSRDRKWALEAKYQRETSILGW